MNTVQACVRCGKAVKSLATGKLCTTCLFEGMLGEASDDEAKSGSGLEGRVFGDYELIEEIGRGGMGLIYRARQRKLNRLVALKLLNGGIFAGREAVRRFRAEAELAARLEHPNIVRIFEIGEQDGCEFFSMALIEGRSLSECAGERGMEPVLAARVAAAVARATQYAHDRGVLHRDIKPANILLDKKGEPHLTDFGIAKILEQQSALTRTNSLLGTPAFMSPEQARGELSRLTVAADVYGLGAVLYYCLTGSAPFGGGTTLETVHQLLNKEPRSPSAMNPRVDLDLGTICLKCLEKDPPKRYPSAALFADDLERWLRGEPVQVRPASLVEKAWKWARRRPAIAALTGTLALALSSGAAGILWQWQSAVAAKSETQRENYYSSIALAQRYIDEGDIPRARRLLLQLPEKLRHWEWGRLAALCFQETGHIPLGNESRPALAWSTDMRHLIIADRGVVRSWSFPEMREESSVENESADSTPLVPAPNLFAAMPVTVPGLPGSFPEIVASAVDARGDTFVVVHQSGLVEVGSRKNSTPKQTLTSGANNWSRVLLSPDGSIICAVQSDQSFRLWDTRARGELPLAPRRAYAASFSPDSKGLAYWGGDLVVRLVDCATGAERKQFYCGGNIIESIAFSADGKYIGIGAARDGVWIYETSAAPERFDYLQGFKKIGVSPDGSKLAAAHRSGAVSVWDTAHGELISDHCGNLQWCFAVAFSPAGDRFATGGADKTLRIWNATTFAHEREFAHDGAVFSVAWHPAGDRLFTGDINGHLSLWDVRSGKALAQSRVATKPIMALAVSGSNTVAITSRDGTVSLWDSNLEREIRRIRLEHDAPALAFAPDQKSIFLGGSDRQISVWSLVTGALEKRAFAAGPVFNITFSPDATRALTASSGNLTGLQFPAIQLWDSAFSREVITFKYASGQITAAHFSPDGRDILSGFDGIRGVSSFGIRLPTLPLRDADYPGGADENLEKRIEQFARKHRATRLERSSRTQRAGPGHFIPVPKNRLPRDAATPDRCIDLTGNFNAFLHFPWRPLQTWNELGDDLDVFPAGLFHAGATPFDVRGLIVAPPDQLAWSQIPLYAAKPKPIIINRGARQLHFLHATTLPGRLGETIGAYEIEYTDGSRQHIPLRYGVEIALWTSSATSTADMTCSAAQTAWTANNSLQRLYHLAWLHLTPQKTIRQVCLQSDSLTAPFLAAITVDPAGETPGNALR